MYRLLEVIPHLTDALLMFKILVSLCISFWIVLLLFKFTNLFVNEMSSLLLIHVIILVSRSSTRFLIKLPAVRKTKHLEKGGESRGAGTGFGRVCVCVCVCVCVSL